LRPSKVTRRAAWAVHLSGVELGDEADALVLEQAVELPVAHRLSKGAVERRDIGQVNLVPDAALAEMRVGQEAELQRRDRALDRHVHHGDGDPAAGEPGQDFRQGGRPPAAWR
jgi:hypothetical protein